MQRGLINPDKRQISVPGGGSTLTHHQSLLREFPVFLLVRFERQNEALRADATHDFTSSRKRAFDKALTFTRQMNFGSANVIMLATP